MLAEQVDYVVGGGTHRDRLGVTVVYRTGDESETGHALRGMRVVALPLGAGVFPEG